MALLLALARNVPQAHASLTAGRVGALEVLGRRARWTRRSASSASAASASSSPRARKGFGMRVIAYDPFVGAERYKELGVEKADTSDDVYAEADFLTLHLPKTPETEGWLDAEAFAKCKDGVRILNVARGPLIVDEDLQAGARQRQGRRRGARRLPLRADHRAPAVRPPQRHRHAAPRRLDRRGDRPRRLPGRRAGRRRADRRRRHDRGQRPGDRGRGPRGPRPVRRRCAGTSGRLAIALAEGSSVDKIEVEFLGRIAERDTRPLATAVLLGVLHGPHRGGRQRRQRAGGRRGARHRGRRDQERVARATSTTSCA